MKLKHSNISALLLCATMGFPSPVLARCNARSKNVNQKTTLKNHTCCISNKIVSLKCVSESGFCKCSVSLISAKKDGLVTKKIKDGFSRMNLEIRDKIIFDSENKYCLERFFSKGFTNQNRLESMYCVWLK